MKVVSEYCYNRSKRIDNNQGKNSDGVFLARDPALGGDVAVKEIKKSRFKNDISKYFEEAQAMFGSDHPNVVPIRVATQTTDTVCLVMPYYKNGSLSDRINAGPISPREVCRIGRQLLSGIAAIHAAGLFHFDVKPSNVLFSDRGLAMVADFGQARRIDASGVVSPMPGMYRFALPPEFFLGGVGTPESDIFQVGLTLYRAANGDPFFKEQRARYGTLDEIKQAVISGKLPKRDAFVAHVPDSLRRVIRKAMSVEKAKRFRSAVEFSNALGQVTCENDWCTTPKPDNECEWVSKREGRPSLLVELSANGTGWDVSLFTLSGKTMKRKKDTAKWGNGLSRSAAEKHLRTIFADME